MARFYNNVPQGLITELVTKTFLDLVNDRGIVRCNAVANLISVFSSVVSSPFPLYGKILGKRSTRFIDLQITRLELVHRDRINWATFLTREKAWPRRIIKLDLSE